MRRCWMGRGLASGCFQLHENNSSTHDADAVWDTGGAGADEFPADPASRLNAAFQSLFDVVFVHGWLSLVCAKGATRCRVVLNFSIGLIFLAYRKLTYRSAPDCTLSCYHWSKSLFSCSPNTRIPDFIFLRMKPWCSTVALKSTMGRAHPDVDIAHARYA